MIRLTLILIAGLVITFAVAGRDMNLPEGSDQPIGTEVAQLNTAPAEAGIQPIDDGAGMRDALAIPLDDQQAALEAALRASERGPVTEAAPEPATPVVAAATAEPISESWYVSGQRVNLRQGPSTSAAVIGQVNFGQEAQMLEETENGWYKIRVSQDGPTGYIFGNFLSPQAPL